MQAQPQLLNIFLVFLKMGATAFGGNVALVAAIRREICEKRKWMSDTEILDLMVIGNILPGPLATNVVFACGKILHGFVGASVALIGVLLPSFFLMCILSWAYFKFGNNEILIHIMNGVIPAVAAIIAATAINLHRKNVKGGLQYAIVFIAAASMLLWKGFFLTLIIVGVAGILGRTLMFTAQQTKIDVESKKSKSVFLLPTIVLAIFVVIIFAVPSYPVWIGNLKSLALTFGSMSVTLFGGGYVFIPAMENVVVHEMGWMTAREFTEGIAIGQITPGPIMISSVFIGWKVAGLKGAFTAATCLFAPPAVIMYVAHHFLAKIKANATAEAIFRGVRPAVIGMIFFSVWLVYSSGNINVISFCIFAAMLGITLWKNPEPILLIAGSAILGFYLC